MAANKWELTLNPTAFIPDATSHPSLGVVQNRMYLAFADSGDETCYSYAMRVPDAYASGTVSCKIAFAMASDITNAVKWDVFVEAITGGTDATDLDATSDFDATENTVTATVPGTTAGKLGIASITLTNKDGMAAGDYFRIKLTRDTTDAADTATGDAHVFWVALYEA